MPSSDSTLPSSGSTRRRFAVYIVQRLREAGFDAYWAGGCVRDQLLGEEPKDYDVATSATPAEIREVFGYRRTLSIGAAFGVITVLGKGEEGQVEVATFREDLGYSDGRHPDGVSYSGAKEDAQRRDFTINGLFFDPLTDTVLDYVGGQEDLDKQIVRAIRDPHERFAEDKLRMLRAVRFAATFGFSIDGPTLEAVQQRAGEITVVSAERIAAEMRRMLAHATRAASVKMLRETGLLPVILPEASAFDAEPDGGEKWARAVRVLELLADGTFSLSLAALIREIAPPERRAHEEGNTICRRWKLSNEETDSVAFLLGHEQTIRDALSLPWPTVQRILIRDGVPPLLQFARAVAAASGESLEGVAFCEAKAQLAPQELNPPPLVSGADLKRLGIPAGPAYSRLLTAVRDAQLEGKVANTDQALELLNRLRADRT